MWTEDDLIVPSKQTMTKTSLVFLLQSSNPFTIVFYNNYCLVAKITIEMIISFMTLASGIPNLLAKLKFKLNYSFAGGLSLVLNK